MSRATTAQAGGFEDLPLFARLLARAHDPRQARSTRLLAMLDPYNPTNSAPLEGPALSLYASSRVRGD